MIKKYDASKRNIVDILIATINNKLLIRVPVTLNLYKPVFIQRSKFKETFQYSGWK